MLQTMTVALLVLGCSLYAAWTLMPSAARRVLAYLARLDFGAQPVADVRD